ncbi:unnamed protein product (macronuclear) [Paramecium tetraurelia]|uniref:Uncharacterized protein n=1 Tax=Paramecium tetraurelia TaxID=5888 RepID=A0CIR5_PARTE|nr:uncharacterized protein GSPATT00007817001 [Paramecium tetraurelia]CAK70682.1 unnamed protein product [Paramecium tetraurelia]|eukprot:XP_001438079.1 hypothetical protein (macronuclear) [Paramecium tetraurelia strain d4-2]
MMPTYYNQSIALLFNFKQFPCHFLYPFFNNKVEQKLDVKQEEGEQSQGKIEDECDNQLKLEKKEQKNKENDTDYNKKIHIFPGQTKNYYKNMGQKILKFIVEQFQDDAKVMSDSYIKQFMKISSQGFNRNALLKLKKSRIARKIIKLFFGNYKWVKPFISQHKAELDLYFRYNTQVYCPQKKQKILEKSINHQIKQEE